MSESFRRVVHFIAVAPSVCLISFCLYLGPVVADEQSSNEIIQELLRKLEQRDRKLEERDKVISDLIERVGELEHSVAESRERGSLDIDGKNAPLRPLPAKPKASLARATATQAESAQPPGLKSSADGSLQDVPAPTVPSPSESAAEDAVKPREGQKASGALAVDEDAAERALERTLVEVGALLLPFGKTEVTPSITYTRDDQKNAFSDLARVANENVGIDRRARQDRVQAALDFRVGLPWDSQFEFGVPYEYERISNVRFSGTLSSDDKTISSDGIGDVSVGLAKTVIRESGWVPDLVTRVTWDTDTGKTEKRGLIQLGSGADELRGQIVALKRQDPLAFSGGFSYQRALNEDSRGRESGDQYGVSIGVSLAASPETSLQMSLQQVFSKDDKFDGRTIEGSDSVNSTLSFGVSSILGRGALLTVTAGAGLTDSTPDYFVRAAIPIRFNTPFLQ